MYHRRSVHLLAAVLLPAMLMACGSSDEQDPTAADTTVTAVVDTTTVPVATVPDTTAPDTTVPDTTVPDTTVPDTTADGAVREINSKGILTEGRTYTSGTLALGTEFTFTANAEARYATNLPGFFGVSTQASGNETLFYITDLSTATVFKNPFEDYAAIGRDNVQLFGATEPIPGDYLEYFQQLPGVTTGEIVETTVSGLPARSMTFTIGSNEGGHAIPPDTEPLLLTFFSPSGITYTYRPGDSGTLYLFELAGKPTLAEVTSYAGADEFFAGFTLSS